MGNLILLNDIMLKLDSIPTKVDGKLHLENINIGAMGTILGFVIVFLVLIVICLLLAIFSMLVQDRKKQEEKEKAVDVTVPVPAAPVIPVKVSPSAEKQNYVDDKELVAVITAAIAASMGKNTDGFVVRRIRRVGNWNNEAIEQQQQSGLY